MTRIVTCPLCGAFAEEDPRTGDYRTLHCELCGGFEIMGSAEAILPSLLQKHKYGIVILPHWVQRSQSAPAIPRLDQDILTQILDHFVLPSLPTQADNFILWLGNTIEEPGSLRDIHPARGQVAMCSPTLDAYVFVLRHLFAQGYLEGDRADRGEVSKTLKLTLSFTGWRHFETLRRGAGDSRVIFMAMPYHDDRLDTIYQQVFKPAVKKAGFDLIRLDERPRIGLIDDHLRVEIRRSAILIAELTGNNPGAYWEAGYAEGLGKPVLYTCEEGFFRRQAPHETTGGTHFDTNHLYTVLWREGAPKEAEKDLKAAIRVTLPHLATMSDD